MNEGGAKLAAYFGFGAHHHLHSQRVLTLSEDLPLVAIAVDTAPRIDQALAEVAELGARGLVTLERARLLSGSQSVVPPLEQRGEESKLTAYCGRQERAGGRLAYRLVVELLHRRGVACTTVMLGVDGTLGGVRRRGASRPPTPTSR